MSILVDKNTKVLVQGLTGKTGTFHTEQALAYHGTKMVGGIHPKKGGETWTGVEGREPADLRHRRRGQGKDRRQRLRHLRAAGRRRRSHPRSDRGRDPADRLHHRGIPVLDMVKVKARLDRSKSRLIGPNCPGVLTPDECKIGIMPGNIFRKGSVGVVSRSGTLTYEAVFQTTNVGLGQTTAVGIGGDPVKGTEFIDVLEMFLADDETKSIIMIGEIGGSAEEDAAQFLKDEAKRGRKKPMAGFIAGRTAPAGRTMGHAGAVISGGKGGAEDKIAAMESAGIKVSPSPARLGTTLVEAIKG